MHVHPECRRSQSHFPPVLAYLRQGDRIPEPFGVGDQCIEWACVLEDFFKELRREFVEGEIREGTLVACQSHGK